MRKNYALFDFDGTLIRGDSILLFCLYAHQKGYIGHRESLGLIFTAVRYGFNLCSAVLAKERVFRFLAGRSASEVDAIARDFDRTVLVPRLRPQGLEAIARHRAAGDEVLLISASSTFYLEPLKERLGVNDIIGTRFDVNPEGVFTGRVCGDNCRGVQKALRLAEYLASKGDRLDYEGSVAYGDSYGDIAMLNLCARKVAVNPKPRLWRALQKVDGVTRVRWEEPASESESRLSGKPTQLSN